MPYINAPHILFVLSIKKRLRIYDLCNAIYDTSCCGRNSFCWARMDCMLSRLRELGSILSVSSLFHKFHNLSAPLQALLL